MLFYITYRPGQEQLLPACVQAVRTFVQDASRVAVVGPALPPDVAATLDAQDIDRLDHSTIFPGLTSESMVVVPRAGGDMGPELFQRMLSWTLAYHAPKHADPRYAVAHATFAPSAPVPLTAGPMPLLPLDSRTPDPRAIETARGIIGPFNPPVCFSRDYMVFDRRIVQHMIDTLAQLNPRRRFDEVVLNRINLDDPEFSEFDTYGWFAAMRFPQNITLRRPDGTFAAIRTAAPPTPRPPGGGVHVSFGKKA